MGCRAFEYAVEPFYSRDAARHTVRGGRAHKFDRAD
jgi:hypothetical protein